MPAFKDRNYRCTNKGAVKFIESKTYQIATLNETKQRFIYVHVVAAGPLNKKNLRSRTASHIFAAKRLHNYNS